VIAPAAPVAVAGSFTATGERWTFAGTLTFDDATAVLRAAAALPLPPSGRVDMAGLSHADSAALAVLLALQRRAQAEGRKLAFEAIPQVVVSLAHVYGIEGMFAPA
jgi:phospholipid transport system transporter-binding protein